ncbi:MAG: hypothetical protein AAGJ79_01745 [Verrucomicrobiota bacterium]
MRELAKHAVWVVIAAGAFYTGVQGGLGFIFGAPGGGTGKPRADIRISSLESGRSGAGEASLEKKFERFLREDPKEGGDKALSAEELAELVAKAGKSLDPLEGRRSFDRILASITRENAPVLREGLLEAGVSAEMMEIFDFAWGAEDPDGVLDYLQLVEESQTEGLLANAVPGWASKEPQGAIHYVEGLSAGEFQDAMTGELVKGLAVNDLDLATSYITELQARTDREVRQPMEILSNSVVQVSSVDEAVEWVERLPAPELQEAALDPVGRQFARERPEDAMEWAERFARRNRIWRSIVPVGEEIVVRQPRRVYEWIAPLPPSAPRLEMVEGSVREIARDSIPKAEEMVAQIPDPPTRDAAIDGLLDVVFERREAFSVSGTSVSGSSSGVSMGAESGRGAEWVSHYSNWASEIQDPGRRETTIITVADQWLETDPGAAMSWLTEVETSSNPRSLDSGYPAAP